MIEIVKPRGEVEDIVEGRESKFVAEPLERGFGQTLGNSLRRILLGALPGAAPVGIRITGVNHEFSTIEGVKEDVTEIILNLKRLVVRILVKRSDMHLTVDNFNLTVHLKIRCNEIMRSLDIDGDRLNAVGMQPHHKVLHGLLLCRILVYGGLAARQPKGTSGQGCKDGKVVSFHKAVLLCFLLMFHL